MIDEFSRIEQIKGQRARNVLTAAKSRRQTVAVALADCPPGEWIAADDLFTTMRLDDLSPTIARIEMALWKLYLEDPHYEPRLRRQPGIVGLLPPRSLLMHPFWRQERVPSRVEFG